VLGALPLRGDIETLARQARIELAEERERPDEPIDEASPGAALGLTEREAEVIRLVAAGWSNQQIADALFITRKTASVHVSNIMGKLGAQNRVEAAAVAHRLGLAAEGDAPHI
jgi:DNA-binding NarL/FixJ family response regulator